jgi:hypothetical protein
MNEFERQLERAFSGLLSEVGQSGRAFQVSEEYGLDVLLGASWADGGPVSLAYHPVLKARLRSEEDLRLLLRHEVCHLLTAPSSQLKIPVIEEVPFYMKLCSLNYVDLYREYIAHAEFCRRFGQYRQAFLEHARNEFMPDNVVRRMRVDCEQDPENGSSILFFHLFRIFYDAIFFHLTGDDAFKNWASATGNGIAYKLFTFAMEDIEVVESTGLDYWAKLILMGKSFWLLFDIDAANLTRGKICLVHPLSSLNNALQCHPRQLAKWEARKLPVLTAA